MNPITTTLTRCARCGQEHVDLVFQPLTQPQEEWSHWAPCPATQEPIMLATMPSGPEVPDKYAMFTALVAADRLAKAVDKTVDNDVLDPRSAIGDARLQFGEPHKYPWLTLFEKEPTNSLPAEPAAAS